MPNFYRVLQEQDHEKQISNARELRDGFTKLIDAAHPQGPFFLGSEISFADIQVAPWILRLRRVLKPYRGWPDPDEGSRWALWVNAIEENEHVRATTSTDELYLDSYERYARKFASAINIAAQELTVWYQKTGPTPRKSQMQSTREEGFLECCWKWPSRWRGVFCGKVVAGDSGLKKYALIFTHL